MFSHVQSHDFFGDSKCRQSRIIWRWKLWATSMFLDKQDWNKHYPAPRWGIQANAPRWGAYSAPCLTLELICAARRARRRSKALNEKIPMRIKKIFKSSHVRSRSGQRSAICVFGLLRMIAHRDRAINSRAPKLSQTASLQQESSLVEYYA